MSRMLSLNFLMTLLSLTATRNYTQSIKELFTLSVDSNKKLLLGRLSGPKEVGPLVGPIH